ncbi:MAG: hypothetical protein J6P95_04665 [Paludibacteraceae bacterium]|nr:hypothetical protein [Paludibacteraceae bacterium]
MDKKYIIGTVVLVVVVAVVVYFSAKSSVTNTTSSTNSGNSTSNVNDNSYYHVEATQDNEYTMYSSIATGVASILGGTISAAINRKK